MLPLLWGGLFGFDGEMGTQGYVRVSLHLPCLQSGHVEPLFLTQVLCVCSFSSKSPLLPQLKHRFNSASTGPFTWHLMKTDRESSGGHSSGSLQGPAKSHSCFLRGGRGFLINLIGAVFLKSISVSLEHVCCLYFSQEVSLCVWYQSSRPLPESEALWGRMSEGGQSRGCQSISGPVAWGSYWCHLLESSSIWCLWALLHPTQGLLQ